MSHPFDPPFPSDPIDNDPAASSSIAGPVSCYIMVVDILGFSKMIKNLNNDEQIQKILDWIELVETNRLKLSVRDIQLISDTLFVREEDSIDGLTRLLRFAQLLLECGVEEYFPLRGAIVHGDAAWGKLIYGKAVIQAHQIERSLDWLGIACAPNLPRVDSMWAWDMVVVYPVPRKEGEIKLLPAVSWNVPLAEELVRKVSGNGLMAIGDIYRWKEISKVERTIQFGLYLKMGVANHLDPKYYEGGFPMHTLEKFLTGC